MTNNVSLIFFDISTRKLHDKGQSSWRKNTEYWAVIIIAINTIKMTPKLYTTEFPHASQHKCIVFFLNKRIFIFHISWFCNVWTNFISKNLAHIWIRCFVLIRRLFWVMNLSYLVDFLYVKNKLSFQLCCRLRVFEGFIGVKKSCSQLHKNKLTQ